MEGRETPALETPELVDQGAPWLRFQVGGHLYAIPLDAVAEVTPAESPRLIPFVSPEIGGILNVRGEPVPAVYGGIVLGGARPRVHRHLMVLERGKLRVGVLAEEVTTIERGIEPPEEDPDALEPAGEGAEEFVRWIRHADGPLGLVAPEGLLERATAQLEPTRAEGGEEPCQDAF